MEIVCCPRNHIRFVTALLSDLKFAGKRNITMLRLSNPKSTARPTDSLVEPFLFRRYCMENTRQAKSGPWISSKAISAEKIMFEALISKKQLVNGLGVSSSFVSKLMVEEGLPYFKIGRAVRFRISEVSQWLERRRMS